ncbi:phage portal protein [Erysipelotrichaceae bacterium OttesenSCG-928-M19]|nr:phage portal protein [Erysipelotrichaceae bacterium OttesenSCG-928-M19]
MGLKDRLKKWLFSDMKSINSSYITSVGGLDFFLNGNNSRKNITLESIYHKIANDMSNVTVKHIKKVDQDNWIIENTTDLAYIVGFRPNKRQSQADLFYSIAYSLMKYKNAIVLPIYKKGAVSKLEIESLELIPTTTNIKIKDDIVYIKKEANNEIKIPIEDLIIIRERPYSLFEEINIDLSSYTNVLDIYVNALTNQLMNNGKLKGYLKMNANSRQEDLQNTVKNFVDSFSKENTAGIAGLDNGMEFIELKNTYSAVDNEIQKEITKEIYKIFGLNESVFTADASEQQSIAYYNSTLEPLLKRIKQEFSAKLIDRELFKSGHRLTMTLPKYDNASLASFTTYADKMLYHGAKTINEIRDELNDPPVENGDIPRTNANAVELAYQNEKLIKDNTEGGE